MLNVMCIEVKVLNHAYLESSYKLTLKLCIKSSIVFDRINFIFFVESDISEKSPNLNQGDISVNCNSMPFGAAWAYYGKVLVLASAAS